MRPTRTAAAALLGTTVLFGLTAAAPASAKGSEPAWVSPAQAQPGQSVAVSVTCATSTEKSVTATSAAFAGGSTTLSVGPDGKYSGNATVISEQEMAGAIAKRTTGDSSWGIDGKCPNGDSFVGAVAIAVASTGTAEAGAGAWEGAKVPHGGVETGLGGSVGVDGRQLAAGGALVAAGIGGFWLLRRRGAAGRTS
ncbi:hypothetical protein [Streptomyces sp. TLI_171]|uniref:hypothetical protein n=1 Tax=Streptomyces sp. TLI_171 TaxID=1938859 RepID=UPI000C195F4E|nr:hypothetical protein [Streptomyces sp. TLI_171]RKE22563.1 hypothetical protein BX266_6009 [Streptomyces sp. TLI_171]